MKRLLLLLIGVACTIFSQGQLLTWSPSFPLENNSSQTFVITVDATKGNTGLLSHNPADVYVHIGVVTNMSAGGWKSVPFTWATTNPAAKATYAGNNKWQFTITGSLRTFFNITDANETIQKLAILFRSGDGNKKQANTDGSDMYVPVYTNALAVRIEQPITQPKFIPVPEPITKSVGESITFSAVSSSPATLRLYLNGTVIQTSSNATSITATPTLTTAGNQVLVAEADNGTLNKRDTIQFFVSSGSNSAPLPAGVKDGINYETDNTAVTLVLRAPGKNRVTVIGEFPGSNWSEQSQFVMNKTPDGKFWWLRITGLTPGVEYAYQYLVDGTLRIADPYTEKVLDPFNDPSISAVTYPNLKPYPAGQSGFMSVLQTAAPAYTWGVNNFSKPDKRGLVIYELLLRDFLAAHDWKTLRDTLSYLKRLGINAIEVMPFNEFEGNNSWGYNGFQYFAPDKYYGPKNSLKQFIDSCHKNGIAVIMDIVLNHTYGPSPLAQLYWDGQNNRPAANNPWYNAVQPHAFGFGEDFNHESADTKYFFNRVVQHWLSEYKIDGYRVDFSKGLTQRSSTNDATFSAYDASRIAIINGYANAMKTVDPNAYIILEHFADNTEEKELSDNGMLLWANVWTQYQEASMGYLPNSNLDWGVHTSRGWANPHLVTFMESHDEERVTYKNIKYGNSAGSYNIRDTATALKRMELNAAFLLTIPGPKMIWQFGEVGYDYSRCYLSTNGEGGDCNKKLDPKPIRWDYKLEERRKRVFEVYSQLNKLRFHPWYTGVFQSSTIEKSLNGAVKWIKLTTYNDTSDLVVIGNFDVTAQTGSVTFPTAGTWFDLFSNTTLTTTGAAQSMLLQPGEYHVYVNRNVNNIALTPVNNVVWNGTTLEAKVYPNPVGSNYTLEVNMPQSSSVSVSLFSISGQLIGTVYKGFLQQGSREILLQKPPVAIGTYFLKIETRTAAKVVRINTE